MAGHSNILLYLLFWEAGLTEVDRKWEKFRFNSEDYALHLSTPNLTRSEEKDDKKRRFS